MTEDEWLSDADPVRVLDWLEGRMLTSRRKLQLFVCAACRQVWAELRPSVRQLVEAAEEAADADPRERRYGPRSSRFHDGLLTLWRETLGNLEEEVRSLTSWVMHGVSRGRDCATAVRALCPPATPSAQAALARELFGNPFRKVRRVGSLLCARVQTWPEDRRPDDLLFAHEWRTWQNGTVVQLARGIYEERAFDRMPYLADALEDAGCCELALLEHCRDGCLRVRGCWVLDLLLDRG